MITMNVNLVGASFVNFATDDGTKFDYIKLNVLLDNKNGYGSISQVFKYDVPASNLEKEFGFLESGKIYPVDLQGEFKSNGKNAEFVVFKVVFKNNQNQAKTV